MQHLRGLVAGRERALKDDGHAGCLQGGSLKNKGRDAGVGQGGIEQPQREDPQGERGILFSEHRLADVSSGGSWTEPCPACYCEQLPEGRPRMTKASRLMLEGKGVKRG